MKIFKKIASMKKITNLSLDQRKSILGILFTAPFTIGFTLFLLYPIFQSVIFSLSDLSIVEGGFEVEFVGLENFSEMLFIDTDFRRVFTETFFRMLLELPSILIFSFFAAVLLNQEFRGRLLARVLFFLPVILSADIVIRLGQAHYMEQAMELGQGAFFNVEAIGEFLKQLLLPGELIEYVLGAIDNFPEIIRSSGIQILIFLAALQSIPSSLYEVAKIEGATSWETFWKVTFPMVSPMILVNFVYTIIDTFTASDNLLLRYIQNSAWGSGDYGISVAMSWFYFLTIIILLVSVFFVVSKYVYYES
ncbi:MAG: carbohydrate ABC transporter permease [Bacillota bacterium]